MIRSSAWTRRTVLPWVVVGGALFLAKGASAEETVGALTADANAATVDNDRWEYFTTGRISNFVSWAKGDGMPQATTNDLETGQPLHQVLTGTGGSGYAVSSARYKPKADGTPSNVLVSSIDSMRVRSGFTGNIIAFGMRRKFGPSTTVTGYLSLTSLVDSQSQKKYFLNPPDVREGYIRIEGNWGSVLAGRSGVLFNRGAVVTDFLYLHGYGLGFPADINSTGGYPTAGQIGFGVLANGFGAGFVYSTPVVLGTQLSLGLYDPASLTGSSIERTRFLRPEFELITNQQFGALVKAHVYFNGGYQVNYQQNKTDDITKALYGVGYGTRIEVGPVHLAAGGHRGKGLGLAYPGLPSDAVYDLSSNLRDTDGFFVMAQLALGGRVDLNGGFGRTIIHMTTIDLTSDPKNPTGDPTSSIIQNQTGISGAVVVHVRPWLHFDVDVMFADSKWNLGERQKIAFYNAGTTITW
ncbi:MAG TPA: hypothetical protein VFH73_14365 [Polyangia bacterium]|nr:hypothetical protein [Polyangia bacterium]